MSDFSNSTSNTVISGTSYDDTIHNNRSGSYTTLAGGGGNDSIYNWGEGVSIEGGTGNDTIQSDGSSVTIAGGAGNDTIINNCSSYLVPWDDSDGSYVLFKYNSGDGSDIIYGFRADSTLQIDSGYGAYSTQVSGDDILVNVGYETITLVGAATLSYVYIDGIYEDTNTNNTGTAGADSINNSVSGATISGLGGNDSIINDGSSVSIDGGTGNDYIYNGINYDITINAGADNDTVKNWGDRVKIDLGTGNDYVYSYSYYGTIEGGTGNDTVSLYSSSHDNIIKYTSGDGNDIIYNLGINNTLQIGSGYGTYSTQVSGDDIIVTVGEGTITLVGAANLSVVNIDGVYQNNSSETGTEGADDIENSISGAVINALGGNDTIVNEGDTVKIDGGAGNDLIFSQGRYSTIDGGAGIDLIANYSSNVTIIGSAGNDTILNNCNASLVPYADNDGSYVLFKYNSGDGNDVIYGFKSNSTLQIGGGSGTYSTQTSGNDIVVSVGNGYVLLKGAATLSSFTISGYETSGGYEDDSDDHYDEDDYDIWRLNGTTATYGTSTNTLVTVSGVKSTTGLVINTSNKTVTVNSAALNESNVTISNGYTLVLANDVASSQSIAAHWSGTTYKSASNTAGYSLVNNQIVYTAPIAETDLFTISGITNTDGITIYGTTVTVSMSALNNSNVSINNGYTLALANDVTAPQTTAAHWSGTTYKSASNTAGYSLLNNQINYTAAVAETDLFTLSGVQNTNGITINGTTVTVPMSALNQANVSITNGYTLALTNDVTTPQTTAAHWELNGLTATYKNTETSAGYQLINNQIIYKAKTGGEDLITINGVKSLDGISQNGTIITLSNSALNQETVTISNGYTLATDQDVPLSETTPAGWTLSGSLATYKNSSTTAGYKLENNQLVYKTASGGETVVTVDGVKSENGLTIDISQRIVTVAAEALNNSNVTVSNGYTLALANNAPRSETTRAGWTLEGANTAIYRNDKTTAGYKLNANNQIVYNPESGGESLITITGVKSTIGLVADTNQRVVTVGAAALGTNPVTVDSGYTLKLAEDVQKPTTTAADWTHNGTTATYKGATTTAGYTITNNVITYSAAKAASTVATITGINKSATPTVNGKVITLKKEDLSAKTVSVDGTGYEFNFAKGNYKKTTIKGSGKADQITTNGSNVSVIGGKGNDTIKMFGTETTVKGGAGNDLFVYKAGKNNVIADYAKGDKISIVGSAQVSTSSKDVIFTVGSGKMTVKGGKNKKITYTDKSGENIYDSGVKTNDTSIQLLENYSKGSYTIANNNGILTVDASAVLRDISLTGNNSMNSIIGGKGNDTLIGGGTNDTLTGGDGSDTFVYANGDGNDVITDYTSDDRIKITSGTAKVKKDGKDIIVTVGNGKITMKNAADKIVTYIDAKGKTNYYPAPTKDSIIINGTDVTVLEKYKSKTFDVSNVKNGNNVKRIDASPVSHDLKIVGNAKANIILGGSGNDTIYAGAGNDTLQGDEGKNVFVYQSGNDVILDYDTGDKISLASGSMGSPTVKDSNVVFKVGKGKVTLTNGADKVINVVDKKGNSQLIGNDAANTLKGGSGNDTLTGGKGNDSLWGNKGNDIFIYNVGDGKDTIMDYQSGDLLQIVGGTFSKSAYSKGTLALTVGNGSITMKNVDTSTTFNINGKNYKISGNKLK